MHRYLIGAVVLLALILAQPALAAPTITHYAPPQSDWQPHDLALGGDGNVWFTEQHNKGIGRVTPAGAITEFTGLAGAPSGITSGPGGLWFTESGDPGAIGRITTGGFISEFTAGLTKNSDPTSIVQGPDGNLWFTESAAGGAIGRITPTGEITEFRAGLTNNSTPRSITVGPDGNLWFAEKAGRIGRITTQGQITEFSSGITSGAEPVAVTAAPDGNVWFTEHDNPARIGRITPQGVVTEFSSGITPDADLRGIAAGRDGSLLFAENHVPAIARITTAGAVTEYPSGAGRGPVGVTTGSDGNLWFSDLGDHSIGWMTVAPGVTATTASHVASAGAQLSAGIAPNSQATTYYFEYGTTTAYGNVTSTTSAGSTAAYATRTASIGGLAFGTTYHARAVAANPTGTTYGPDHVFTTTVPGAPVATTEAAAGVTSSNATLAATVNPQGLATTYHFEWGPSPILGTVTPQPDGSLPADSADHTLTQDLSGLEPNKTYYYRIVATSTSGTTYGEAETLTTSAVAPDAATGLASSVTDSSAALSGRINPRNGGAGWHFDYGTNATFGSSAPDPDAALAADNSDHQVTQALTGLEPNTTYHYRLVATGDVGRTTDSQKVFKTDAIPPSVQAADATSITTTGATLGGAVNAHNSDTTYRFEWGETTAYGHSSPTLGAGDDNQPHQVALPLDGLTPGTTYHFRVVASSDAGETAGDDRSLTTATPDPDPPATDPPVINPVAPTPKLGTSAVASPVTGTVLVRPPGAKHYEELGPNDVIPVGARIDTRRGTIDLVTALPDGRTQKAKFWNGVFTVRQSKKGKGYTDIYVAPATGCRKPAAKKSRVSAARKKKRRPNSLWGHDNHGRYRSHGRRSVALVRGTTWLMEERCEGSYTKVKHGKVSVRDLRRKKTVLVRAGHSYLARARR
jgi:streptogramin lyase